MKIGYADPPYPGCAHYYKDHPDFAGEVDHAALVEQLERDFDGWILHTHVGGYRMMERDHILPADGIRICQWVKPFAAFKRNVPVAFTYEPVIIKECRKPTVSHRSVMRDYIECPITMQRGLTGVKPERVCHWAFEIVGALPDDELIDMFPGTGAVMRAWRTWQERCFPPKQLVMIDPLDICFDGQRDMETWVNDKTDQ